jgi:hypothetical protein
MGARKSMQLALLGDVKQTYTSLDALDFGNVGQVYGTMVGSIIGDRLSGTWHLTNLARRRPDDINEPALRGLLTLEDGARAWVELDGIAILRPEDQTRVFVTSCRFHTGEQQYAWLNSVFGILEGVLDVSPGGRTARCQLFECRPTLQGNPCSP